MQIPFLDVGAAYRELKPAIDAAIARSPSSKAAATSPSTSGASITSTMCPVARNAGGMRTRHCIS